MDWNAEHRIAAALDAVEASVLEPETLEAIVARQHLVGHVRVISFTSGPGWRERVADFEPNLPDALLPRIVERDWIGWRETVRWDTRAHEASFHILPRLPEALLGRFRCAGRYSLHADGDGTVRRVRGELVIRAPMIGAAIETWVSERLTASFDQEAEVLLEHSLRP